MRRGERTNASTALESSSEGYACDAAGLISRASSEDEDGAGSGYCVANEGRESLEVSAWSGLDLGLKQTSGLSGTASGALSVHLPRRSMQYVDGPF